jgi:hypothetical protein
MSGQCIDCYWRERDKNSWTPAAVCHRPDRHTGYPVGTPCDYERRGGRFWAWLHDECGRSGRHFWLRQPKGENKG